MTRLFATDHPWLEPNPPEADAKLQLIRSDKAVAIPAPLSNRLAPPAIDAPTFAFRRVADEEAIIATLDTSARPHELPSEAFRRKEHELGALFALLSPTDSVELDRRLSVASPSDPIAFRFGRLTPDRRARLIAFLRDVRRRAATVSKSRSR